MRAIQIKSDKGLVTIRVVTRRTKKRGEFEVAEFTLPTGMNGNDIWKFKSENAEAIESFINPKTKKP